MFTVIVLVNSIYVNAQQTNIDSLKHLINSIKADTSKIILYENLAQAYRDARKLDSSILTYQQALALNQKINFSPLRQCYNMSTMDYLYYVTGNYTKSLEYAAKALILSEKLHDLPQMAHAHQQFGFNYMAFGNYREALNHFFKAKKLFEQHNHPEIDLESPAFAIVYIGYIYLKLTQPDSALVYVQSGYKLASTMDQRYVIDFALRIFGDIFLAKNNNQLALNYYRQYINDFYKYDENNRDIGFVLNNMSKIFQKRGQADSTIFYAKKALSNGKEYKDQENIYDAANVLSELYAKKDEYKNGITQKDKSNSTNTTGNKTESGKIDSLKKDLTLASSDSDKIDIIKKIAQEYFDEAQLDSAIQTDIEGLEFVRSSRLPPIFEIWQFMGLDYLYMITGNYSMAIMYAEQGLERSKKIDYAQGIAHNLAIIGCSYEGLRDYQKAVYYLLKAKKAYEKYESGHWAIQNIAEAHLKMHNLDSALYYNKIAYHIADTGHNQQYMIDFAIRIFGAIYIEKSEDSLALKYCNQFVSDFYKYNLNNREIDGVYLGLAKIYQRKNKIDSAVFYTKKSLEAAKHYNDEEQIFNASQLLYNLNDGLHNESEAFKYYKIAEAAKDSMASIEKIRQIQSLEFAEQTREKEQQEADTKQAAKTKRIIIIASVLVSITVVLIWNRLRQLRLRYKSILEQKESEKLKTQLLELEAKALRAQMNPHFIFNCMNSIKLLMQQNENEKAINYLTTFSKLIRTIFQNSDKREISLYDEIETCKLYTRLESMRFANKFSYAFSIEETIDLKLLMVPALIIQPFIENAIWHGIMPKEDDGCVKIIIKRTGENVLCIIDDDGIGRETSRQNKFQTDAHESKGVHLTQSRIDLDNLINQRNASLEIVDKINEPNISLGTRVILTFKEY